MGMDDPFSSASSFRQRSAGTNERPNVDGVFQTGCIIFMEMPMPTQDIRWIQRFNHFIKAFAQLKEAVELTQQRSLSKLEEQGLIQAFEYTHELAWNTLKDFL